MIFVIFGTIFDDFWKILISNLVGLFADLEKLFFAVNLRVLGEVKNGNQMPKNGGNELQKLETNAKNGNEMSGN